MGEEEISQSIIMMKNSSKPQVVVIPYPAQGHINSFLHISLKLISNGFNIIFINTDFIQTRLVLSGLPDEIKFVSFPDGLEPWEDRAELGNHTQGLLQTFPPKLEELIMESFSSKEQGGGGHIACVLADVAMAWTLQVADKLGVKGALHWTMPASFFHLQISWPHLQQNGTIDSNGTPLRTDEMIQLCPGMPIFESIHLPWYCSARSPEDLKLIFNYVKTYLDCLKLGEWWLCNSFLEVEPESFALHPKLSPIGPLVSTNSTHGAQLWSEDLTCLHWLDQQNLKSVVYVAFGSFTIFNLDQFQELALGLDLLGQPVLWVVRIDFNANGSKVVFPDGFQGKNIKIVSWAPQLKVLGHPATACFVSHCGWNSTMEGVLNGLPFLCWPYFSEQYMNKSYICDIWKVGLGLEKNEDGIVTRCEVRVKVEQLLGDKGIQEKASKLKEIATKNITEGGNSWRNLNNFIQWLGKPKLEQV